MRVPSSSHCAAALRIGRLARDLMDAEFTEVLVELDGFKVSIGGDYHETLLWVSGAGPAVVRELSQRVQADAILQHEFGNAQLVELKAAGFLSEEIPVIPLDEVIETAQRVAAQMPRELRCTALGGLSTTQTSLAIEQELAARKIAAGGSQCSCLSR
jgi:L-serine deaminase